MVTSQSIIRIERELGKDKNFSQVIEKLKGDLVKKAKKRYSIKIQPLVLLRPHLKTPSCGRG